MGRSSVFCNFSRRLRQRYLAAQLVFILSLIMIGRVSLSLGQELPRDAIEVGRAVQVSVANASRDHSEVILAADPSNPRHLLACSMVAPREPSTELARNVAYLSFDGGDNWSNALEFGGGLWSSDPSCIFGGEVAYYAALVFDEEQGHWRGKTVLYAAPHGGPRWSRIATLSQGDREFLLAGTSASKFSMVETVGSPSLAGGATEPLVLYQSSDGGDSFQTRAVISTDDEGESGFGYPGGILPDGTLAVAFTTFRRETVKPPPLRDASTAPVGKLRVLLYSEARQQVRLPTVDDLYRCDSWRNSTPIASLAVDASRGVFGGRMYVAWPDSRSGPCRILLSWSADEGSTWSAPVAIDDEPGRRNSNPSTDDDFHPVLAVNQAGVVGVAWCDRRDSQDGLAWRTRFTASLDGGLTFLPSMLLPGSGMTFLDRDRVNLDAKSDGGGNPPFRQGGVIHTSFGYWGHALTGGETAGLVADAGGTFHALWVDNRTGRRQVWTARIAVEGRAVENGSAALSRLRDISSRVAVRFSDIRYDRLSQTITAQAYIENTSTEPIHGPFAMRVLHLGSREGSARFVNADNHALGSGAIFDFNFGLPGGTLEPRNRIGGKDITIRMDGLIQRLADGDYEKLFQIVTFDSVVLADPK